MAAQTSRRAAGSRPWVSSSRTTSCVRLSRARTRKSRCRCPPDSAPKAVRRCRASPNAASSPPTGADRGPRNSSTASPTRNRSGSAESCCWLPTSERSRGPSTAGSSPSTRTEPPSARRSPCRHSTVVVLPAPLAPSSPTISPSATSRSTPSTTVRSPYRLRSPRTSTTAVLITASAPGGSVPPTDPAWPRAWGVHIGAEEGCRDPPSGGGEAVPVRVDDRAGPVPHAELGEDAADVRLDGRLADHQRGGDLGVGRAGGHLPQHVQLPVGERVRPGGGAVPGQRLPAGHLEDPRGDRRVQPGAAAGHGPSRRDEVLRGRLLEHEAGRAGLDRSPEHLVLVERGEDQHRRPAGVSQPPGRLDT